MINKIFKKYPLIREMFLYGLIGGTSALLDALLFVLFRKIGLPIYLSNFISINAGIALSFVLNTYFNFKKKDNIKKRAASFFSVGYIGLLISFLILYIFVTKMHFNELLIKLISIVFVAAVQFVLNKLFTYGNKSNIFNNINIKDINKPKVLLYSALELILILFLPVLVSLLGFLVNITISRFHFIISILLMLLITGVIGKKQNSFKEFIVSTIISFLLVAISVTITWTLYDYSYDGVNYHLHSVISLINGWNPIKEVLKTGYLADMNANYFAGKGVWYYSASIAKLFGNLNVTKTYILISSYVAYMVVYYIIKESKFIDKMSKMYEIMISFFIVFNPVIMYQFMTNYTDVYMSNLILILIFSLIYITKFNKNKIISAITIMAIIIMGNIKVTGIFFAFIFCAFYFIIWFIDAIKSKKIKPLIEKSLPLIVGGLLIFVIGMNPYFTNIKNGKNMFHPVMGKEKIDLVGDNCPKKLQNKSNIKQLYYSIISTVNNSPREEDYISKNPLAILKGEMSYNSFDIRLSGWGPLFQLITILSVISSIVIAVTLFKTGIDKKKKENLILLGYTFVTVILVALIFPDAWWARYYPIIWILPLLLLMIMTNIYKNKTIVSYISIVLMCIMLFNNIILFYSTFNVYYVDNKIIKTQFRECKNNICYVSTIEELFRYPIQEMFKNNNTKVEFKDYTEEDWDYSNWLMATKVKETKRD